MTQTESATRNAQAIVKRDAREYVRAVRRQLADVPWRRRKELLTTVRESVDELPTNKTPSSQLGPPDEYARDLRESVGLSPRNRSPLAWLRAARPRRLVAVAAALVLVVALIAGSVYREHYQPTTAYAQSLSSTAKMIDDPLVNDTYFYRYAPGQTIVTGIDVRNTGWATMTIDDAEYPGPPTPLKIRELRATTDPANVGVWQRAPKVDHVTIAPGKSAWIFVVMTMDFGEIGEGARVSVGQPNLRTHVLGVEHIVPVVGNAIGLVGPDPPT